MGGWMGGWKEAAGWLPAASWTPPSVGSALVVAPQQLGIDGGVVGAAPGGRGEGGTGAADPWTGVIHSGGAWLALQGPGRP